MRVLAVAVAVTFATGVVVVVHDSRTRTVASGTIDGHRWMLRAWRTGTQACLDVVSDGVTTGAGCGFDAAEPNGTADIGTHALVFGPVLHGVPTPPGARTYAMSWVPPRRAFMAFVS